MKNGYKRPLRIFITLMVFILLLRYMGVGKYFTLGQIQEHSVSLKQLVCRYYIVSVLVYILSYAIIIAAAIPAVAPLTLLAGYLFNTLPGVLYAEIGATLGATTSFLLVRYAMSNIVRSRYGVRLDQFNKQLKVYGYSYLLTLQLLTVIPFFVINTLAGLANVPLWTFVWTTAVGSFPLLFIYSLAGRQLGELQSVRDILKPHMIAMLVLLALLALLPILIRRFKKYIDW